MTIRPWMVTGWHNLAPILGDATGIVLVTQTFGGFLAFPAPLCFTPFGTGVGVTHSEEIEIDEGADEFTSVSVNFGTEAVSRVNFGTACPSESFTISANAARVEGLYPDDLDADQNRTRHRRTMDRRTRVLGRLQRALNRRHRHVRMHLPLPLPRALDLVNPHLVRELRVDLMKMAEAAGNDEECREGNHDERRRDPPWHCADIAIRLDVRRNGQCGDRCEADQAPRRARGGSVDSPS